VTGEPSQPRPQLPDTRSGRQAATRAGARLLRPSLAPTARRSSRSASSAQAPTRSVKPCRTAAICALVPTSARYGL